MMHTRKHDRVLIVHVIHRLDIGGMENGLVNIINRMPAEKYQHVIICLDQATDFRSRVKTEGVEIVALNKRQGQDFGLLVRLWKVLRRLRPAIVHTRNIGTLEASVVAAAAGVRCRVHGEHGWDIEELGKKSRRYRMLRRLCKPFIIRYIAVSKDAAAWLQATVGISGSEVELIYNGVDTNLFCPKLRTYKRPDRIPKDAIVIGTVGRAEPVKDPLNLVRAFVELRTKCPGLPLWLVMVGDGTLRENCRELLRRSNVESCALLPGFINDVPNVLRSFDIFVLPSRSEGLSNVILEAMATGLPTVATDVGGNSELIVPHETGELVPPCDSSALARAIRAYAEDADLRRRHGEAARARVEQQFSIGRMAKNYMEFYDALLAVTP